MSAKRTLKVFFEEKQLKHKTYYVDHKKQVHMVESDFLINVIVNITPAHEQEKILETIRKIDFANGDVHHFLEHLAKGYVLTNY
ncbi:hypothetical protein PghCCS26_46150 [Paenibacillus glycanilyticus]|uniref:Uncharacterized protein n=1 Tax=Paenibacillus glycanilyticus TaxID=126569 RepID=A0ABQ6NSH0_9BACL|nr:hypothetical protein [Paenibacillus glycanilyticus]GMK47485.1 hypothetical protein PghCCS26_46150 [Paenibacillus glycanilyticus]